MTYAAPGAPPAASVEPPHVIDNPLAGLSRLAGRVADPAVFGYLPGRFGVRCVAGDQLVFHADEEDRAAWVALPSGPPAQLVVHPDALVPPRADDIEPAERGDLLMIAIVAAQADVGAPARHLGGHGDRPETAGLGHDRRLGRVVFGIEHGAWQAFGVQLTRQPF